MENVDEGALHRWIGRRDAEAFKGLTTRYAGMVYATCRRILGDATEAEDVSQECFEILAQVEDTDRINSLGAWLHGMATNRSLKRVRSEERRKRRELRFSRECLPGKEGSWDDVYVYVDEAIEQLAMKHREPVVLHFFDNKSHEAIARQLGVSRTTVTYRIGKGVEEIRRRLKRQGVTVRGSALTAMMTSNLGSGSAPKTLADTLARIALAGTGDMGAAGARRTPAHVGGTVLVKKLAVGLAALVVLSIAMLGIAAWRNHAGNTESRARTAAAVAGGAGGAQQEQEEELSQKGDGAYDAIQAEESTRNDQGSSYASLVLQEAGSRTGTLREPQGRLLGTVNGHVVDMFDVPVEGAAITVTGRSARGHAISAADGTFRAEVHERSGWSDPSQNEQHDLFTVVGSKESYIPATKTRVTLNTANVELVLAQDGEIRGYVLDSETGEPIVRPEARIVRHRDPVEGMMGTADPWTSHDSPEGRYALRTKYDVCQIAVRARGYVEKRVDLQVRKGEIREDVLVELDRAACLRGVVLDARTGKPVQDAHVGIAAGHIRQWWGLREGNFPTHAQSGPDGRFEISHAPPDGNIDIIAWHKDYAAEFAIDVSPAASADVKLLLSQGGQLTGTVRRQGEPVAGLRMWAGNSFSRPYEHGESAPESVAFLALAGTDTSGAYMFSRMPYGRYQVRVMDASPNTPLSDRYLLRRWVEIKDGETTVLDVDVESGSFVSGSIIGLDSFDSVQLRLYDQRFPQLTLYSTEERHDSAKPDGQGYFRFPRVPEGDYYLRATLTGDTLRSTEEYFHVDPMDTIEVVIDFHQ